MSPLHVVRVVAMGRTEWRSQEYRTLGRFRNNVSKLVAVKDDKGKPLRSRPPRRRYEGPDGSGTRQCDARAGPPRVAKLDAAMATFAEDVPDEDKGTPNDPAWDRDDE
jgi:hypothetical protein